MIRSARRRLAALAAVLVVPLGGLVAGSTGPAAAAGAAGPERVDRVLSVGVPGLVWSDVDAQRTPHLWSLAETSAIGALSVRAGRSTTCVLDGWATLGAGNRTRYPGPVEPVPPVPLPSSPLPEGGGADPSTGPPAVVDTRLSYCGLEEQVAEVGLADPERTVARIAADEATARFGAEPGALGQAVPCSSVVGRAASLAVAGAGSRFTVRDSLPADGSELATLLAGCPLTLVSLGQLSGTAPGADATDDGTPPIARQAAVQAVDAAVGRLRAATGALPGTTLLLLQGISEVNDGRPQLHVGLASGPGTAPGWLSSASTGRAPFAQLIDVAPTILRALGLAVPASMNGQPFTVPAARPALPDALAELARINTRAVVHYRSTGTAYVLLVVLGAVVVLAGMLLLGGGDRGRPRAPAGRRPRLGEGLRQGAPGRWGPPALRLLALAVASLPVSTYLANLVPWELAPAAGWALAASVAGMALLVAAVAALGPWRRRRLGPPVVVLAATLVTLAGDVLTGSHLELDGLLGYDAIVAGRFTGYGNLTFGLLSVSALLLTAGGAAALVRRSPVPSRRHWLVPVGVAGVCCVAVVGAPFLGRDFGGVLAAVPGFGVLAMLLARIRVTVGRLVAVLAAAVGVVALVAVLDWLRPASERTHLGRFVAQVLDGRAWTVVSRKAEANVAILLGSSLAWMLLVALVAAVWLLRPGGLLRSRPGRAAGDLPAEDLRVLRAGLTAVALSLTVGALVNDSGVALPATAATLLVPLLVWLAAGIPAEPGAGAPGEGDRTPGTAGPRAGATGPGVNVGARGSTGRTS